MTDEIILNPDGLVTQIADDEGNAFAVLVRPPVGATTWRASIQTVGPKTASGFPVMVTLIGGGDRAEIVTPGGFNLTLPAGAGYIYPPDLGFDADINSMTFWIRAASATQRGLPRKRILRALRVATPPPPPIERMTLSGELAYSTTGVVGAALTITRLPTASRTPDRTETVLRLYTAQTEGTVNSAINPAPATVPNNNTLFGIPVYRAYDAVYDEWIEVEAASRFDISSPAVSPTPVLQSELTITAAWKSGGLRQQAIHTFLLTGSPHGTLLQAQIVTNRYTTGWIDCVPQAAANVWGFGVTLMPADQPGSGRNPFEFYDMEDRFKIRFRRRANTGVAWSGVSGNMVFPWPTTGGAEQFNATPTTRQGIIDAITAGAASGSGCYVIGLAGNIDFGGNDMSVSNRNKTGEPIVIKSISRLAPVVIRGIAGRALDFSQCSNIVLDRIEIRNDRTAAIGYPAGKVPMVNYADGHGVFLDGCLRIHVTDCLFRDLNVGWETRDCDDCSFTFFENDRIVQDGWRLFRRNGNILIEGEYGHDPVIYQALALSAVKPNYHPDGSQISTDVQSRWTRPAGSRMGGNRNIRRMFGRSYGAGGAIYHGDGYWGGEACRLLDPTDTDMATGGARHLNANILWEGMYIETCWDIAPFVEFCDGFTIRNSVIRDQTPGSGQNPRLRINNWGKNFVIENTVYPRAPDVNSGSASAVPHRMTTAQMQAQFSGSPIISGTAWPAGWTGGATRYPTGPDAYRQAA